MGFKMNEIKEMYKDGVYGEKMYIKRISDVEYLFNCEELNISKKIINKNEVDLIWDKYIKNGYYEYNDDLENKRIRCINMNKYICFMGYNFLNSDDSCELKDFINFKWNKANEFKLDYDKKVKWLLLGDRDNNDVFNDKELNNKYIEFIKNIYGIDLLKY